MIKSFLGVCSVACIVMASQNHPYFMSEHHGYIMDNQLDMGYTHYEMNDQIDVLDIKESEVGTQSASTGLGDFQAQELFLRYKLYERAMLRFKYEEAELDYGLGKLYNKKYDLFIRHGVISRSFAVDFGVQINQADDITSEALRNKAVDAIESRNVLSVSPNPAHNPIIPGSKPYDLTFNNSDSFGIDSSSVENFLKNELIQSIRLSNMKDQTYYIKATRSFVENKVYSNDIFMGYAYTNVNSKLNIDIVQNTPFTDRVQEELDKINLGNLDRDEHKIMLGFNQSWFVNRWLMDVTYEFNYIKRDKELNVYNTNHKLEASLGYEIFDNTIFFIGAKFMTNQFIGEIPYLYNEYTQSSFDKKYGWAKTGIIYRF